MAKHVLKSWNEVFDPLLSGEKNFDVRRDDRDFQRGDELELHEYDPELHQYSGRIFRCRVTHVLRGASAVRFGLQPGYCVCGLLTGP